MGSTPASLVLFGVAVGAYCIALVAFVLHLAFRRRALGDIGMVFVLLGWPLHFASIFTRAFEAGHWPLGNMYEYSTGIAFVIVTVCVVLMVRARMRLIGLPAMIVAISLMGVAYMLYVPPGQLVPALHSYWLTIHVTSMATSSAILSFSFFFGMAYLARRWADQRMLAVATAPAPGAGGGAATLALGGGGGGGAGFGGPLAAVSNGVRRRHLRSHLGRARMGPLLGLGSEGDVRLHHVGRVCHLPARTRDLRVEGEARSRHHRVRVRCDSLHAVRGEPVDRRPALLRARVGREDEAAPS
jgi:hypothetical protein